MLTQKVERNYHLSRLYSSHYCFLVDKTLYCFCSHNKIQLALLDHEEQCELCTVQCHSHMERKRKKTIGRCVNVTLCFCTPFVSFFSFVRIRPGPNKTWEKVSCELFFRSFSRRLPLVKNMLSGTLGHNSTSPPAVGQRQLLRRNDACYNVALIFFLKMCLISNFLFK